ncbi:sigma 54-interacting transcriptional regulator [Petroclostridium sp. X23]|uniref:sigma-54-dependent Fis family transcriptional regulator n=1 Tax=Petroclostridium sp. X23 TaxID=3045146 RepID=UPI0024AE0003|nr:sigma 54-interacting transcriptional regulator [Petroclostridium sp. X23]WHH58769.1 sigma 54-interacting transcriptional regulator [Petroclostridium sp. X23]
MPGKKLLSQNQGFIKAWELFTSKGTINRKLVRDIIADSWLRSKNYDVDPWTDRIEIQLTSEQLAAKRQQFSLLIKTAKHFMESMHKLVGSTGLIVRLTDKDGYILEFIGDKELIEQCGNLNLYIGCNVKEESIGTNAIGTALATGQSIQVLGAEHYCKQYHKWTSSASPIRDENDEVMGVISMTGPYENVHPHTLGMVVAAAEAIENEMKLEQTNKQLQTANKHFYAIMESISEGLITINNEGIVMDINLFARRFLSLNEEDIVGKSIRMVLDKAATYRILKIINSHKKYEESEVYFKNKDGRRISCIISVTPIKDMSTQQVEGIVITFKEARKVHKLVNRIVGAEAIYTFDDIIGESKKIKDTIKIASAAADNDSTILLMGESGTGKEMFAHSIHNKSPRRNKPFVFLNCAAIPRDLVATELFGYVDGAFTGARRGGHPGKFELADGGTIFLDEIGDMPLETQTSLLRVLETKEIVRIGGHDVIPTNVRVIAATHKDLNKEVELGNFRKDLYYRLNVMPIHIPPLRQRKKDIKVFIDYFINKTSINLGKKIVGVSNSFYEGMINYNWPGNVRELQNVVQMVINIVDDNTTLAYEHLPANIKSEEFSKEMLQDNEVSKELMTLEEIEKMAIYKTIQAVEGNIVLTSKILGIGRSTLYRKLDKYELNDVLK